MTELERLSNNIDYIFESFSELIDSEPKSISMNYVREDGSVRNFLFKNVAQYKKELLDSLKFAQNLYEKEIYIDPEDGDDSNTGNGDEPIKTFKEALDRTANIAHTKIILAKDVTINWSDYYLYRVVQKTIRICSSPNNTDAKLIVNLDGQDYANFGSILLAEHNGVISIECDVDIKNEDDEQRWFIGLNGGKVYQWFNYGKFIAENKAEAVTISIDNNSVFVKSLFGRIEAVYLYASMQSADTSKYCLLTEEPTEIKIVYPKQSYINGETLDKKGELAKWVESVDIDNNHYNGFLLDENNSNRAINAICNPRYLQDA